MEEEIKKPEIKTYTEMFRENPWMLATFVLGVLCLFLILGEFIPMGDSQEDNDKLANCLTEKGLIMFGVEGCGYCGKQKELFGESFKLINYFDCDLNQEACSSAGITGFPTWVIDEKGYPGLRSLDSLKELAGC